MKLKASDDSELKTNVNDLLVKLPEKIDSYLQKKSNRPSSGGIMSLNQSIYRHNVDTFTYLA